VRCYTGCLQILLLVGLGAERGYIQGRDVHTLTSTLFNRHPSVVAQGKVPLRVSVAHAHTFVFFCHSGYVFARARCHLRFVLHTLTPACHTKFQPLLPPPRYPSRQKQISQKSMSLVYLLYIDTIHRLLREFPTAASSSSSSIPP
jgi:hypothetical protein